MKMYVCMLNSYVNRKTRANIKYCRNIVKLNKDEMSM